MDHGEIAALAEGMVPFVRDCVAEATAVPPELAEQIASAVRLLHESPAHHAGDTTVGQGHPH